MTRIYLRPHVGDIIIPLSDRSPDGLTSQDDIGRSNYTWTRFVPISSRSLADTWEDWADPASIEADRRVLALNIDGPGPTLWEHPSGIGWVERSAKPDGSGFEVCQRYRQDGSWSWEVLSSLRLDEWSRIDLQRGETPSDAATRLWEAAATAAATTATTANNDADSDEVEEGTPDPGPARGTVQWDPARSNWRIEVG